MTPLLFIALDWWVPTPEQAAQLELALEQYWQGEPVQVLLGAPEPDAQGVWEQEGELVWVDGQRRVQQPCPQSLGSQVLLVRSWTQALEPLDAGWVPEVELESEAQPEALSAAPGEPSLPSSEPWTLLSLSAGLGLRSAHAAEPWRLAVERGHYSQGLDWSLGFVVDGAGHPSASGLVSFRGGPMAGVGVERAGASGQGEAWVLVGARAVALVEPQVGWRAPLLLPSAGLRLRWWGPGQDWRVGVGLSAMVEGSAAQRSVVAPDGSAMQLALGRGTIELSVGRAR